MLCVYEPAHVSPEHEIKIIKTYSEITKKVFLARFCWANAYFVVIHCGVRCEREQIVTVKEQTLLCCIPK